MTEPLNFPEPAFGIVADSLGTGNFSPGYTKIEPGITMIQIIWKSAHALSIHRSPLQSASTRQLIGQIPAGAVSRTENLLIQGIGVAAGETAYLSFTSAAPAGTRLTTQVITTPLKTSGGGVVSRTFRGLLDILLGVKRKGLIRPLSSPSYRQCSGLLPQVVAHV